MGESLLIRRVIGGLNTDIASAPPVLNTSNPINYTMKALETISLSVFIEENNINCTYQWFVDNELIYGATESVYSYTPNTGTENITTHSIKCAVTNNKGTTYSRDAIITVYSTRWYIIKDYSIVDETATLTTPYNNSNVQIDDTYISSSNTGNRYCELESDIFSMGIYKNKFCAVFNNNSYYNSNIGLIFNDGMEWGYSESGRIDDISSTSGLEKVWIYIGSSTEGSLAYIQLAEVYIE